jgi:hypothetical protein
MTTPKIPPDFDSLPSEAMVSIAYVAWLYGLSILTVRRWSVSGRLPKIHRIGPNTVRLNVDELRAAMKKLAA